MDSIVLSELQCPICLELYRSPVILPCSHVLCRAPCAEQLFAESRFVRCPVCRDGCHVTGGVSNLQRVRTLENIINRLEDTREDPRGDDDIPQPSPAHRDLDVAVSCQLCHTTAIRPAVRSCVDCNASYCTDCLRATHPNRAPFNQHDLIPPRLYPRPRDLVCVTDRHHEKMTHFCGSCKTFLCPVCIQGGNHGNHDVRQLEEAFSVLKGILRTNVVLLERSQESLAESLKLQEVYLADVRDDIAHRKRSINDECDALVEAVEAKRRAFLLDLEVSGISRQQTAEIEVRDSRLRATDGNSLAHYAQEVLKERDLVSFLQVAARLNDRVLNSVRESVSEIQLPANDLPIHSKVVDLRKFAVLLGDIGYLKAPKQPSIEAPMCSRSRNWVLLTVAPPGVQPDVVDGYNLSYSIDGGSLMTRSFAMSDDQSNSEGVSGSLLIDGLRSETKYYFCVRACNKAGDSLSSEIISCVTLSEHPPDTDLTPPVPVIEESLCRPYSSSIKVHCSDPVDRTDVNHQILYRQVHVDPDGSVWHACQLYSGRSDHRVFNLQPDTQYELLVIAYSKSGSSEKSNKVSFKTECSITSEPVNVLPAGIYFIGV